MIELLKLALPAVLSMFKSKAIAVHGAVTSSRLGAVYMRRATFVIIVFLGSWALFFPESFSEHITAAGHAMPAWLIAGAATVFGGVWQ